VTRPFFALSIVLRLAVSESFGGPVSGLSPELAKESEETSWEYSLSIATYLAQNARDYANPNFTADRDWLHLEARYQYEATKTGSIWLGYNFSFGEKLAVEATPMVGGVFGDITGVAPGYTISARYKSIKFFTQGEYFFDSAIHAGDFLYTWSELSYAPAEWFRLGLVLDRTKALGSSIDIRRGPLVGFKYKKVDLTTYWLSPGTRDGTFIFSVTVNF
jgi:hypothetical protein